MAPPEPDPSPASAAAPPSWPVIGTGRTLTESAYEVLRDRILAGDVPPGTFVREEDVGAAMGVSRTPVREALSRLATEGFVERLPHRGFRVPERSLEDLVHLYPVLQALEVLAGELAFPHLAPADLRQLDDLNDRFAAALASGDLAAAIEHNDAFHHAIAARSGNPVLGRLLDDLRAQVRRLEVLDFTALLLESEPGRSRLPRDRWARQHTDLVAALRRGDRARARDILRQNRSLEARARLGERPARATGAA